MEGRIRIQEESDNSMRSCEICEHDFLEEDIYECEKCHKKVCPDCIVNTGNGPDDPRMVCKNCIKGR